MAGPSYRHQLMLSAARPALARPFLQSNINPMKPLTALQKRFGNEFIKDENGRQACIRAGYSPKAASQQASKLLQDQRIQVLIAKLPGYSVPIEDTGLDGHLRKMSVLRNNLEEAGDNPDITTPQVSALRGAVDAEVARGKALGFYGRLSRDPEQPPLGQPKAQKTMGELLRGTAGNGSRKEVEPQTNGSGEGS